MNKSLVWRGMLCAALAGGAIVHVCMTNSILSMICAGVNIFSATISVRTFLKADRSDPEAVKALQEANDLSKIAVLEEVVDDLVEKEEFEAAARVRNAMAEARKVRVASQQDGSVRLTLSVS